MRHTVPGRCSAGFIHPLENSNYFYLRLAKQVGKSMALGIHIFYGKRTPYEVVNMEDYFIGRFVGDQWNDEIFIEKMQRIEKRISARMGIHGYTIHWAPGVVKAYKRTTDLQRYRRRVNMEYNAHRKKIDTIIKNNSLFIDDFIAEEINRLHARIAVLKTRYNQN